MDVSDVLVRNTVMFWCYVELLCGCKKYSDVLGYVELLCGCKKYSDVLLS